MFRITICRLVSYKIVVLEETQVVKLFLHFTSDKFEENKFVGLPPLYDDLLGHENVKVTEKN